MMRVVNDSGRCLRIPSRWGPAILALALLALAIHGCGGITGTPKTNQAPDVIFVDTPPGGTKFNANPIVYWYGTDIDGRIIRYDYAVIPETTVQLFVQQNNCTAGTTVAEKFIKCASEQDFGWISIWVDSAVGSLPTNQKVRLYASFDTLDCDSEEIKIFKDPITHKDTVIFDTVPVNCVSKSVPQYMFVRAIDDQGAASPIKYRTYLRDNHWPETVISLSFDQIRTYLSQPALTPTYEGISIAWNGSDKGDFIRELPTLEYHWRVFGPYPKRPALADTLGMTPVLESKSNDPRSGVWIKDTITALYNLWGAVDGGRDTTRTTRSGYFAFLVQSRDDAFVPDPSPAMASFMAVNPKFERNVLLIDETAYVLAPWGCPSWKTQARDSNQAFLARVSRLINDKANPTNPNPQPWDPNLDMWERPGQVTCPHPDPLKRCSNTIPLVELAKHRLVLYEDDDLSKTLSQDPDMRVSLRQYMGVGGKVWLNSRVGLLNGTAVGPGAGPRLHSFLAQGDFFAPNFFDIEGLYFAGWYNRMTGDPIPPPESNDEFIAMNAVPRPEGPDTVSLPARLEIDTVRLNNHYNPLRYSISTPIRGVPAVGFVVRWTDELASPVSRPLYTFDSYRPGFGPTQGRIVGLRVVGPNLQNPVYKTAYFCSPLWFFKEDQLMRLVDGMSDWFFNTPIQSGP